jgi:hypothetical protein
MTNISITNIDQSMRPLNRNHNALDIPSRYKTVSSSLDRRPEDIIKTKFFNRRSIGF